MWKMELTVMRTETNRDQLSRKANPTLPAGCRNAAPVAASPRPTDGDACHLLAYSF